MTEEEYSELQDLSVRTVTLDIEVDDRSEGFPEMGEERILSIVAHDNYSDEVRGFIDLEGRDIDEAFPDGAPDGLDALDVRPNERQMLIAFRSWFQQKDPDLVTGWNADDFDIPFIIKRMDNLKGVNPNVLSPEGWSGFTNRGEPRIKGRTVYDLLEVYKKNSFTELRSYTLDDVAQEELDAEKIQFDGTFHELYTNDPERFIEYNARDVLLSKDINEQANVIGFRDTLRREVGVSFEDSYDNKDFVDMMCRRKLKERGKIGPSRPAYGEEPDSDYEGAHVMSPYEGVAKNVVGIDLASLYPYTMAMTNASPETKVERVVGETEPEFIAQDGTVLSAEDVCQASNGQYFRTDVDGLFKELVDWAISLKSEYKRLRENADSDEEYEFWEEKYNVAKTLTNSLYGVTGWERFFLYDERVAEAVTLTGQTVIKRTAEYVEAEGHEVLYGDSVPDFEPVTIRNAHGDINVVPIEEAWEKFEQGRRFQVWCDSGWVNVENAIRKPNRKDMYRVRTGDGVVHVTEDHGLLRPDGTEVTPTEISVGDELMHTPHSHPSFESTTSGVDKETAWLWGLFAGDGTCGTYNCDSGQKNQWKISGDTRETLEHAATILEEKGYTPRIEYVDSNDYTGRLMASETAGLVQRYRYKFYTDNAKKRVPRAILNGTDKAKRAFLEGYQAADGDKDDRYDKPFHRSHTNSETFAQGIAVLLQSLGRQCGVNVRDNYGKEYTRIWSRQAGGGTIVEEVERVEYTGDYVYDLSTESEHFNAGVGTLTVHNTDSTYIKFHDEWDRDACLSVAFRLCDELNETVYPELAESIGLSEEENLWEIETEVYMKRFFQAGKKKRYAYLPTWKDGREIDEPEPSISGFSSKRSDSSKLTEKTEKAIFEAILSGESDRVSTIVFEAAQKIKPSPKGEEWELLGIPGGMNKKITDDPQKAESDAYYAVSVDGEHTYPQGAHPRATYNANKILKLGLSSDTKPMRVYLKPTYFDPVGRKINVIAFEEGRDLEPIEDKLMLDVSRMTDTLLREPLRETLAAIDVNVNAAVRGHTQKGLGSF